MRTHISNKIGLLPILTITLASILLINSQVTTAFGEPEAGVFTQEPVYYTQNGLDRIEIFGLLPSSLVICETVPTLEGGIECDPFASGPSVEIVDPSGLRITVLDYVPDVTDEDVFSVDGKFQNGEEWIDFETWQLKSNYVSTLGTYTINLFSGHEATGEIIDSTTFSMEGPSVADEKKVKEPKEKKVKEPKEKKVKEPKEKKVKEPKEKKVKEPKEKKR